MSPATVIANGTTTNITVDALRRVYHASLITGKDGVLVQGGYLLSNHTTNGTATTAPAAATAATTASPHNSSTIVSSLLTLSPSFDFAPKTNSAVSLARDAPALAQHTMTLTPDGRAIILGGINAQGLLVNLSQAYVMDTQSDTAEWKIVPISGSPPDPRVSFSTVLVNTTTMLVYGGTSDFRNAFWVTFYLDLPSMSWSAPAAKGTIPKRWGHTATMAGTTMVVTFGVTSHKVQDTTNVALLDTTTNTWINQYDPKVLMPDSQPSNSSNKNGGQLSIGAVLAIAFFVTAFLVGGTFWLFVRRRKRRTRNTIAREIAVSGAGSGAAALAVGGGDQSARRVLQSQDEMRPQSFLGRAFGSARNSFSSDHRRVSVLETRELSLNHSQDGPISILNRMSQLGQNPVSLGYPEDVVQHGSGAVPVSGYIYPNQANVTSERSSRNRIETLVVYHALSRAQQEALRLTKQHHG
ncbi:hypothetical protein BGZ83_004940 [Gryganskiella cystojenkinii]|nr:hypothetical protein BGZ83_004940 [Gryganskiella cystojenkinii]